MPERFTGTVGRFARSLSKNPPPETPHAVHPRALAHPTQKFCPECGEARIREYVVVGPLREDRCDPHLKIIASRLSHKPIWRKLGLAWLVSPPNPPTKEGWYELRMFATCRTLTCSRRGRERLFEHEGRRQFGRIGIWKNAIRSALHRGVNRIIPL